MSATGTHRESTWGGTAAPWSRGATWHARTVVAGWLALLGTILLFLFTFSGWVVVAVAAAATALLARDHRLGPVPAAMLVALAIPVGRGAEVGLSEVAGVPVRPHDAIALVGAALALPAALDAVRSRRLRVDGRTAPIAIFLAVGVLAAVVGFLGDNMLRDIVRDVRWWALYAFGLLAVIVGTRPAAIVRALVWGMTLYAVVVLVGMLLPGLDGGMKIGAYLYDERMRLHYGQAIFLVPAIALAAHHAVRRPIPWLAIVALLGAATSITLTRALMAVVLGTVVVALAWTVWGAWSRARRRGAGRPGSRVLVAAAAAVLATGIGLGAGIGAYSAGTQIWLPAGTSDSGSDDSGRPTADRPAVNAADRIVGREGTELEAQAGGRLASYARAFLQTASAPAVGHGAGELTYIDWVRGEFAGHTRNAQPGVDNAYLTVGLKAGALGIAAIAALLLWPLRFLLARPRRRLWAWFVPAWLGMLGLTLIQSFAVSGYAPLTLSVLASLPLLLHRRTT